MISHASNLFLLPLLVFYALVLALWVGCLVHAARRSLWGWFVTMLIVPFVALVYPIAGHRAGLDAEHRRTLEGRRKERELEAAVELSRLRRRVDELERRATGEA
jgi:hypothetical protein